MGFVLALLGIIGTAFIGIGMDMILHHNSYGWWLLLGGLMQYAQFYFMSK